MKPLFTFQGWSKDLRVDYVPLEQGNPWISHGLETEDENPTHCYTFTQPVVTPTQEADSGSYSWTELRKDLQTLQHAVDHFASVSPWKGTTYKIGKKIWELEKATQKLIQSVDTSLDPTTWLDTYLHSLYPKQLICDLLQERSGSNQHGRQQLAEEAHARLRQARQALLCHTFL